MPEESQQPSTPEIPDQALGDLSDDEEETFPDHVLQRIEKLQILHQQREKIMHEQYLKERIALEKKYERLLQPLYRERATIVKGDNDKSSTATSPDDITGIPQFWVCAMTQMEAIGAMIAEEDVDCLEYLQDIVCTDRSDGQGFTLEFYFKPNPYFTNSVLQKEYNVPNLFLSDEPLLKNVAGTAIHWKDGKSLTHRTILKKQRGKGKNAGQLRTVSKVEATESFFHWFSPPEMPAMDAIDEEEAERLEKIFDSDYDVAQAFRCHVIPQAVAWFSGKVRTYASTLYLQWCRN